MTAKKTKADIAAEMIKDDILSGNIPPNTQLKIQEVSKKYKIGQTPIREALNKLTQSGLVQEMPLKGFFVTPLSAEEIKDIFSVRKIVETKAFELAIKNGDDEWEGNIISAAHQLYKKLANIDNSSYDVSQSIEISKKISELYETIMSACNSPSLLEISKQLWTQCDRYKEVLQIVAAKDQKSSLTKKAIDALKNTKEETETLVEILIKRDEKAITKYISDDIDIYSKMYVEFLTEYQKELSSKNPKLKNKSTR